MKEMIIQKEGHVSAAHKETNQLQALIHDLTNEKEALLADLDKSQGREEDQRRLNEK